MAVEYTKRGIAIGALMTLMAFALPLSLSLDSTTLVRHASAQSGTVNAGSAPVPTAKPTNSTHTTGSTNAGTNESWYAPAEAAKNLGLSGLREDVFKILSFLGFIFTFIGGNLLDVSVGLFAIHMAGVSETLGLDETVKATWGVVRDLFNLFFIFGLILIGFQLILGINESNSRKTLGSIVIAALLINFSLYATQILVDFSNVLSYQIAGLIDTGKHGDLWDETYPRLSDGFTRLSGIQATTDENGLSGIAGTDKVPIFKDTDNIGTAFGLGFLFMIFYTILGLVFMAGAFLLFTRFIALILLMIFSPVFFIGMVLPYFKSLGVMWQKQFVSNLLVGPVYLFMLYIAFRSLSGLGGQVGEFHFIGFIFQLLLVAAFLIAAVIVAKKVGGFSANQAMNANGAITGLLGRNTLGRVSSDWNKSLEKKGVSETSIRRRLLSSVGGSKFGGSYTYSQVKDAGKKAAQSKARASQVKNIQSSISDTSLAGTEAERRERQIKMEQAISGASNEQIMELLGAHKKGSAEYKDIVRHMSDGQFESLMKAKPEDINDAKKAELAGDRQGAVKDTLIQNEIRKRKSEDQNYQPPSDRSSLLTTGIKAASDAQLKTLGATELTKHAADLKQDQFDNLMKSKDFVESEKQQIREARNKELIERFKADGGPVDTFKSLSDKDAAKLPKEILKSRQAVPHITGGMLKQIASNLSAEDRREVARNIMDAENVNTKASALNYLGSPEGEALYDY